MKYYSFEEFQKKKSIELKEKLKKDNEKKCIICNINILTNKNKSGKCPTCKTKCPSKIQLEQDLSQLSTKVAIGKKYGVTDNAVKKWMKKYNI